MEKKNDITREQLIIVIAKAIKESVKKINPNKGTIEVPLQHFNWYVGGSKNRVWSNSEVEVDGKSYKFYDKIISDEDFVVLVSTALKESGEKGEIKTNNNLVFEGYYSYTKKEFDKLIMMAKPCKEFSLLNKTLKKYTNKEIKELSSFNAKICGKRSSHETYDYAYLDYNPKECRKALDFIRDTKTTRDILTIKLVDEFNHGDESDYKYAMSVESEWYGSEGKYVELNVTTPKGKVKGVIRLVP